MSESNMEPGGRNTPADPAGRGLAGSIVEGKSSKGGVNQAPTTPPDPAGQGVCRFQQEILQEVPVLDPAVMFPSTALRELLDCIRLCERALEERDPEAEEYAAKTARAVLHKYGVGYRREWR